MSKGHNAYFSEYYDGDVYLSQSFRNFDAIYVVFASSNSFTSTRIVNTWDFAYRLDNSVRFGLYGECGERFQIYGKKNGSNDTFWKVNSTNMSIVDVYGLNY